MTSLQTGAFRREVFERVGAFDETLAVVEDVDFNTRIGQAGFRLLLDPSIRFWYVPRATLRTLWRQISGVGRIKVAVLRKHPHIFKLKYIIPSVFLVVMGVSSAAVAFWAIGGPRWPAIVGGSALTVYAAVVAGFAITRLPRIGPSALWLVAILPVLHVGYGFGFLRGVLAGPR